MSRRVHVTAVIERDEDRVLFAATEVSSGRKITFHVKGGQAHEMADLVESGEHVEARL